MASFGDEFNPKPARKPRPSRAKKPAVVFGAAISAKPADKRPPSKR